MEMPQEIEVWYVIPAIRREIAKTLKEKGMKQTEIAKRMGLTKSAVTQYLNAKRAKDFKFKEGILKDIQASALRINNSMDTVREIQYILGIARKENFVCDLHMSMNKSLPNKCDVCFNAPKIIVE
jgi:uncharacterized protein